MSASPVNTHQDDDPDQHLSRLAALELARRSVYGVFMHPCLLLIFALGGSIGQEYPRVWTAVIAFLFLLALSRFFLARGFEGHYNRHGEAMVLLFALLMTLHNLAFSISVSTVMWHYGFSSETGMLMMFLAVSAAGGTSSLAVRRDVHLLFLMCTMIPPLMVILFAWEVEQLPVLLGTAVYVLFLVREGGVANRTFEDMAQSQLALGRSNKGLQALNFELNQVIADRVRTEDKLQGVESRFFTFLDQSSDPVIVISDGNIIYANQAAAGFFDREVKSLINFAVNDLIHGDYRQLVADMPQVSRLGDASLLEIGFLRPDGSTVYGEARWTRTVINGGEATLAIIRDQTQRRKSEDALRKSEQEFRYLIERSPDSILVTVDRNIIYANQSAQRLSGYSEEELRSIDIMDLIHPDDLKILMKRRAVFQNGETPPPEEMRIFRKNGEILVAEFNAFNASFAGNQDARIVLIRDLTSRRAAENALKEREEKVRQSQKLEAIGTLAGGIAHDFNNMLSAIVGYTELAMIEVDENSSIHDNLNAALLASQRATDLVRQILTFSRRDQENKVTLELESCIRSALVLLKPSIPASVELRSHFNTRTSTMLADQTKLQQIIINLYINAADALGQYPGYIELSLDDFEVAGGSHISLADGSYLRLVIRDNGSGMSDDVLEHVFEPFYTTKDVGEGTGLGLSLVHSIVEAHDGLIEVESEVGKGTAFTMYFPRSESLVCEDSAEHRVDGSGEERILVVDDDDMVRNMLEKTLVSLGYQVVTKNDGIEALEAFKAEPDGYNLVISDVQMPKMRGDELAREILNLRDDQAIILCSGYSRLITEDEALAMGVRCYLAKPIRRQTLTNSIRGILDKATWVH